MSISRRTALATGAAAIVTGATVAPLAMKAAATKAALAAPDPRIEDIQALVSDLRNCDRSTMMAVYVAFQEVADRLEALPGVAPIANEWWCTWRAEHHDKPTNLKWPIGPYLTAGRV